MLKYYTFSNPKKFSNCSKDEALHFIETTKKPLYYRYGFGFKGAEKQPISREKAIEYFKKDPCTDVNEYDDYVVVNQYSANDLL